MEFDVMKIYDSTKWTGRISGVDRQCIVSIVGMIRDLGPFDKGGVVVNKGNLGCSDSSKEIVMPIGKSFKKPTNLPKSSGVNIIMEKDYDKMY